MPRNRSRDDESLLLRSAESLGRMIGSLQRQLDIATGRLAATKSNGTGRKSTAARSRGVKAKRASAKNVAAVRAGAGRKPAARKSAKKR